MIDENAIIVADVGGTNARFALAVLVDGDINNIKLVQRQTYPSAEFASLQDVLKQYISDESLQACKKVSIAVAGPIKQGQANVTNLGWNFSVSELEQQFELDRCELLNDFAAFAFSGPFLPADQIVEIKSGEADPTAPIAAIGPGTGFGVAQLVPTKDSFQVVACEGGHVNIPVVNELQFKVLQYAQTQHQVVSVEHLLSGTGLALLYKGVAAAQGLDAKDYTSADVSTKALSGEDDICLQTLNLFCDWLGMVAGNIALTQGAKGGVMIGGGVLPRFVEFFKASKFNHNFDDKGIMSHFVKDIPVHLNLCDSAALIGAAAFLASE